jgi:hypothetical protein
MAWRSAEQLLDSDENAEDGAAFGGLLFAAREPKILHRYRGAPTIYTHQFVLEPEAPCECQICRPRRRSGRFRSMSPGLETP